MKKILSLLAVILFAAIGAYSQAPGIFNYQGVARNSVGNVLINQSIALRLTIHDGAPAGPVAYQEVRNVVTNPFGLFNVQVGSAGATGVIGTIAGVPWGIGNKYIQVEIDPNGGSTFINIGTAQIASVPYALYALVANDLVLPFNKTQADAGTLFKITNSNTVSAGATALEGLTNSTAGNAYAIIGTVTPTAPGAFSSGIRGINNGTGGLGIGVYGSQNGSGWGVYGTTPSGIGVNGASASGFGVLGSSTSGTGVTGSSTSGIGGRFTTTSGQALFTTGAIQFQGIGEGAPIPPATFKILAGDPLGNATWQHVSSIGLVTGSGTVNFVPKWTPSTTNLGNSQIFDNGTFVGINTATPAYKFQVVHGGADGISSRSTAGFTLIDLDAFNGDAAVRWFNNGVAQWNLRNQPGTNNLEWFEMGSASRMILQDATGNLGINNPTPVSRLDVVTTGTNSAGSFTVNNAASTADGLFSTTNATSTIPSAIRGVNGLSGFGVVAKKGVTGESDNGLGVVGLSNSGTAIFGVTNTGISGVSGGNLSGFTGVYASHNGSGFGLYATSNLGTSGRFENTNAANTAQIVNVTSNGTGTGINALLSNGANVTSAIRGTNAATNVGSWGMNAISVSGTGFPGEATHAAFVAAATTGVGIVTSSPTNYGLHAGSAANHAIFAQQYGPTNAAVFGQGLVASSFGIVGNAAAGTGAGGYFTGGTTALRTLGGLQLTGINEAPNRILTTVSGTGQATWQDASTVGIITGSGTLNYVPKWTPTGTNLGNSQIFDDGVHVGIGTVTPVTRLHVMETDATAISSDVGYTGVPALFSKRASNVFNNTNSNFSVAAFNNHSSVLIPGWKAGVMGIDSSNDIFASGVAGFYKGNTPAVGVYGRSSQNTNYSVSATVNTLGFTGGDFLGGDCGVAAMVTGGGTAVNKYAIWANNPGGGTRWAGFFNGQVAVVDGTEGAGKVFTSDASGNGSWQGFGGISLRTFTSVLTIPTAIDVPITQWSSIEYESGGSNYNPLTGEYTIPVTGIYQIACNITWDPFVTSGAGLTTVKLFVNGLFTYQTTSDNSTTSYNTTTLNLTRNFTAGTVVYIAVQQNSGVNQTLPGAPNSTSSLSINMLHQ